MTADSTSALPSKRATPAPWYEPLLDRDLVPDTLIRVGIRQLIRQRLRDEDKHDAALQLAHLMQFVDHLKASPIAIHTADANRQHYEVPARFYELALGKH